MEAAEMGFLQRVDDVTLCNKMCSCEIHKALNVETLRFRIERSQLRKFDYVTRISHEYCMVRQVLLANTSHI